MTSAVAQKKETRTKKEKVLVIVESPAKSKTIKKILGDGYQIEASFGHVRNLPENILGFDVHNDFKPTYVIIPEKKKVVAKLSDLAKHSDRILLASDPDREGEAIAWHVRELLPVEDEKVQRIEFNEITPKAVKYAVEHSREIDMDNVVDIGRIQQCAAFRPPFAQDRINDDGLFTADQRFIMAQGNFLLYLQQFFRSCPAGACRNLVRQ